MGDDDGWIVVKPTVRVKKSRIQKELDRQESKRMDAVIAAYEADMRAPPRKPKEKKVKQETSAAPVGVGVVDPSTVVSEVDSEICKGKVISADQRDKLQKMRTSLGLTRAELGKQINVIEKTVSDYENGKGLYDPVTYNRMINALVVPQ